MVIERTDGQFHDIAELQLGLSPQMWIQLVAGGVRIELDTWHHVVPPELSYADRVDDGATDGKVLS
jgi:hypothetical protein